MTILTIPQMLFDDSADALRRFHGTLGGICGYSARIPQKSRGLPTRQIHGIRKVTCDTYRISVDIYKYQVIFIKSQLIFSIYHMIFSIYPGAAEQLASWGGEFFEIMMTPDSLDY